MTVWRWFGVAGVAACAGEGAEIDFVNEYVEAYCAFWLECTDPALQVFDGIDSPEACANVYGPPVEREMLNCKLDKPAARACLDELGSGVCPADGLVDEALPFECELVWKKCEEGADGSS